MCPLSILRPTTIHKQLWNDKRVIPAPPVNLIALTVSCDRETYNILTNCYIMSLQRLTFSYCEFLVTRLMAKEEKELR
jgi:hypothetical protein